MEHLACGIIYGAYEVQPGASTLQSILATAINLHQHPLFGITFPPAAVSWWTSLPGTPYALSLV